MGYTNFVRMDDRDTNTKFVLQPFLDDSDSLDSETLETALQTMLEVLRESSAMLADEESDGSQKIDFEVCLDNNIFHISIKQYRDKDGITPPPLSPRELQIARLIAKGMQNKGIAYKLGLSPCTISTYTKRIYLKLNVNSRVEMVAKVLNDFALFF